jgi:hypothetical protein
MKNPIVRNKYLFIFLALSAFFYFLSQPAKSNLQIAPVNQPKDLSAPFPVKRVESPEKWQARRRGVRRAGEKQKVFRLAR